MPKDPTGWKPWMETVKKGDVLVPDPLWNQTERFENQLYNRTVVQEVVRMQCQHGIAVWVGLKGGQDRLLSIGWFIEKKEKVE